MMNWLSLTGLWRIDFNVVYTLVKSDQLKCIVLQITSNPRPAMAEEKTESEVPGLRLLTWNMNGVRSFDDFPERVTNSGADIVCIQETKAS